MLMSAVLAPELAAAILMAERQISTQLSIDSGDGVGLELEVLKNVYMKEMELSRDHKYVWSAFTVYCLK